MRTLDNAQETPPGEVGRWLAGFLLDRRSQGLAPGTLAFYRKKLDLFARFLGEQKITTFAGLSPATLRSYLVWLADRGHNPGGIHACYRAVKAFLRFYEDERDDDWRNPIRRVKAPRIPQGRLDPVEKEDFEALLESCDEDTFTGVRDRAILMVLLDTGLRASELLNLTLEAVNLSQGTAVVFKGKGAKSRTVFLGRATTRACRAWLRVRHGKAAAFFTSISGTKLTYAGLRGMLLRRAEKAGLTAPTLHAFRRGFALGMLRNGANIYALQEMMGHADLTILRRYLKLAEGDLAQAHRQASPVDNL